MTLRNPNADEYIEDYDKLQTVEINDGITKIDDITTKIGSDTLVGSILYRLGIIKDYVIESGSNSNGNYEKWASGKLVQWGDDTKTVGPTDTTSGIAYQNGIKVNYPINFITEPEYVGVGIKRTVGLIWSDLFSKNNVGYCEAVVAGVSINAKGILTFYAIGRWK